MTLVLLLLQKSRNVLLMTESKRYQDEEVSNTMIVHSEFHKIGQLICIMLMTAIEFGRH